VVATEECHKFGLPAVVNMAIHEHGKTMDGDSVTECFQKLKAAGAEVVGLNCFRGPLTTLPLIAQAKADGVSGPFAAVPMGYRTGGGTGYETHWQMIKDSATPGDFGGLEQQLCDRQQWAQFARDSQVMGDVAIVGTCCGGWVHHVRAMAEALGRTVKASPYSPDMAKHTFLGSDERLSSSNKYENVHETTKQA
jgi:betaine-homocysteine S-methyltransferase